MRLPRLCCKNVVNDVHDSDKTSDMQKETAPLSSTASSPAKVQAPLVANLQQPPTDAPYDEELIRLRRKQALEHPVVDDKGRPPRVKHASHDPHLYRAKDESCISRNVRRKQMSLGLYDYSPESNAFFAPERGVDHE
jgi:hypothetical protein